MKPLKSTTVSSFSQRTRTQSEGRPSMLRVKVSGAVVAEPQSMKFPVAQPASSCPRISEARVRLFMSYPPVAGTKAENSLRVDQIPRRAEKTAEGRRVAESGADEPG